MKQLYDVCSLIEVFKECDVVKRTYEPIALAEIAYRGINATPTDCLWDSFESALCIASRGKVGAEDFREYANHKLVHEKLLTLRYLKKANPEAYAYVVKTDEIMK